jgi:predicted dehydrogenase
MDGHFEVVAGAFSRDPIKNRQTAKAHEISTDLIFDDWQTMLNVLGDEIDAVLVLTPTPSHRDIVLAAMRQGLHVICEKSLTTCSKDASVIAAEAARHDRHCLVTFNYTGYPAVREMRQRIASGSLGLINQICIEMPQEGFLRQAANPQEWRTRDYEIPTVSLDLGVHVLHLAEFIAPCGRAETVSAIARHSGAITEVIDNVNCLIGFENGAVGNFWWSKAALGYRNGLRVRVFGSEASLQWCQMNPEDIQLCHPDGRREIIDRGRSVAGEEMAYPAYNRFKAGHPAGFIEAFANLYANFAELFHGRSGAIGTDQEDLYSAQAAARGLEILEAVHAPGVGL